jgi:hypothetical protein
VSKTSARDQDLQTKPKAYAARKATHHALHAFNCMPEHQIPASTPVLLLDPTHLTESLEHNKHAVFKDNKNFRLSNR